MPTSRYERAARKAGYRVIAGLDEAGRGSLFGPVFAAAVVLDPDRPIRGLDDSKALEPERREVLAGRIQERVAAWAVGAADVFEIDRINIYQASLLAMTRALEQLPAKYDYLLLDAVKLRHPGSPEIADSWRRPLLFDRRGVHSRESPSGCSSDRLGSCIPRVRSGPQQGVFDAGSPCRAPARGPYHPSPLQL